MHPAVTLSSYLHCEHRLEYGDLPLLYFVLPHFLHMKPLCWRQGLFRHPETSLPDSAPSTVPCATERFLKVWHYNRQRMQRCVPSALSELRQQAFHK